MPVCPTMVRENDGTIRLFEEDDLSPFTFTATAQHMRRSCQLYEGT